MIEIYASQRRIRMYPARVAGSILNYSFFLTIMIFFSWIWKIFFMKLLRFVFTLLVSVLHLYILKNIDIAVWVKNTSIFWLDGFFE